MRSTLLSFFEAMCFATIDVWIWRMFAFMVSEVTVSGFVGMFVV